MDFVNLKRSLTKANRQGGIVPSLLIAPVGLFTTIGALPAPAPVGDGTSRVITADHTFGVSDGFVTIELSLEAINKMFSENTSEADNGGKNQKVEFFIPGLSEELAEFDANAHWEDWIGLIKLPNRKYIQIGSEDFPAMIKSVPDTDTAAGGANGIKGTIMAYSSGIVFYEGAITLKA